MNFQLFILEKALITNLMKVVRQVGVKWPLFIGAIWEGGHKPLLGMTTSESMLYKV